MKTIIALAQTEIIYSDPNANFEQACKLIEDSAAAKAKLILFPELWSSGYNLPRRSEIAAQNASLNVELKRLAQEYDITIGGSWITRRADAYFNTFVLTFPEGQQVSYDKTHLFGLIDEEKWLTAGDQLSTAEFSWGRAGLATCYDLRFPELFRRYVEQKVIANLIVAEWPLRRLSHWQILLRARAIENQAFVIAVNAAGSTDQVVYGGHSCIISPWGDLLAGADEGPELVIAELDMELVNQVRKKMPVLKDIRTNL